MSTGSIESSLEGDLPEESQDTDKSILTKAAELLWRTANMFERYWNESRRHQDDRGPDDYEYDPEESREIARRRREPHIRIDRYDEGGGGKQSWRDWILGIVGMLIVAGIGAVIYQLADMKADLRASLTRQEMDEKRLDRVEARVYRGTP